MRRGWALSQFVIAEADRMARGLRLPVFPFRSQMKLYSSLEMLRMFMPPISPIRAPSSYSSVTKARS